MKKWTCQKCGKETDRRQGLCNDGDEHEWIDTRDYLEAVAAEKARRKRMAEKRRKKATADYQSFLNSAEGKEQIIKFTRDWRTRRWLRRWLARIGFFIIGLIVPGVCVICAKLLGLLDVEGVIINVFVGISFLFPLWNCTFYLEKHSSFDCFVYEANFLASRDIAQNFAYKDEYGNSCVPEPFIPDISYTETEWQQKMKYARKLGRRRKWTEEADEYRKIGNECGFLAISAPAWDMAALCYNKLGDKRALACYKNAALGYKKLVDQGHESAQEYLDKAEKRLADFLNQNA